MTKTNTRRRIVSVLLVLMILLPLMPGMELHAHAFWDDYDTGGDCPNCDHYHWGENLCDCQFCTIDCNYDCWVETHCNDCGLCPLRHRHRGAAEAAGLPHLSRL